MEWYHILLITLISLPVIPCLYYMILYIQTQFVHKNRCTVMQKDTQNVNYTIIKISSNIKRSSIKPTDLLYNLYSITKPLEFYEYKLENTYFPIVIENIIKEYIHFRLIGGFSEYDTFILDYPLGFISKNIYLYTKPSIFTDTIYTTLYDTKSKKRKYYKYNLHIEGGLEINHRSNELMDIKVQ